jgi:hypothetical protein
MTTQVLLLQETFFKQNNMISWPAHSPELNPIQHMGWRFKEDLMKSKQGRQLQLTFIRAKK